MRLVVISQALPSDATLLLPHASLLTSADNGQLLEEALRRAPSEALRDVDAVLELAEVLGAGAGRTQALVMVVTAALDAGDVPLAEKLALQLAKDRKQ